MTRKQCAIDSDEQVTATNSSGARATCPRFILGWSKEAFTTGRRRGEVFEAARIVDYTGKSMEEASH
jgi:hypothetical protein